MNPATPRPKSPTWKDSALVALTVVALVLGALVARDHLGALKGFGGGGDALKVVDVAVDREDRAFFEIVFDRPVGVGMEDQILGRAPATIDPPVGGVWKWRQAHVLRFEASDTLNYATEYTVELLPDRFLQPGQRLAETTVAVRTDSFVVTGANFEEAPGTEPRTVVLRGEIIFNYDVDPEAIVDKVRLLDPTQTQPIEIEIESGYPTTNIAFRSAQLTKTAEERTLTLVVDATLTPDDGNLPLGTEWRQEVPLGSSERLAVRSQSATPALPESSLRVELSSPPDVDAGARLVKVEPEVPFRLAADGNTLTLIGAFVPGESYEVTLAAGFPGRDGARLPEEWTAEFELRDLESSVDFQSPGMFISSRGPRGVAVVSVNVPQIGVTVDRVYRNNLHSLLEYQEWQYRDGETWGGSDLHYALGDRIAEDSFATDERRNQPVVTTLDLNRYVKGEVPGLYRVIVREGEEDTDAQQRWMLVTDLGMVAKRGKNELHLWTWSFRDLAPVVGARVRVVTRQNQTLADLRTDGSGAVVVRDLPGIDEDSQRQPFFVTVEQGDDWSFLYLDRTMIDTGGLDVGGAVRSSQGYTAFLYGERDLYRPGETVRGLAVVRDADLRVPPAMPLVLRHRDPQGRVRGDQRLDLDARGLVEIRQQLPTYSLTGAHTFELMAGEEVIGTWAVQVEEFVPDRIKVQITPAATTVAPGAKLEYTVAAQYLFGPPAAGLATETRVRLVASPFAPPGFPGFTFGDPDIGFADREIFSDESKLDEAGQQPFEVDLPKELEPPGGLEAVVTARVQEQGGRGVAALTRVRVHPYSYYLGVQRSGEEFVKPGAPVAFSWVAVSPDGKPVKSAALRAELVRDEWHTVLRRQSSGAFGYDTRRESTVIDSRTVNAGAENGELTFAPREAGSYRVVLRDTESGASAALDFYASDWGYSPWAVESPARVELDLERDEVAPGENAKLLVKAPFAGRLLITVERERVLDSQIHMITGNTAEISIPVRADWRPNVYITATLVRAVGDLEPGGVGRAFGAIPLAVDRESNKIAVAIDAPEEMRPRRPLEITVTARPGAALTVAAVDEGILQLISQRTPDPFAHFYAKLALTVNAYDLWSQLLPDVKPQRTAGGGEDLDGLSQFLRTEGIRRVEPVALWSGVVVAGEDGKAKVSLQVPEFQGLLRVMAVAHDIDKFGAANRMVRVRDPLVVLPTFPRFLAFGDRIEIPVSVRNDTGRPGRITVALAIEGGARLEGDGKQTVDVPNGAEQPIRFAVIAGDTPGPVRFTVIGSGNGEKATATAAMDLRADLPALTREAAGAITATSTPLAADDASTFRPETLSRVLQIGPVPSIRLGGKLEYLMRYPYGCAEQTVSAAFPLIYLADLAKVMEPELLAKRDPAALVQEALRRLATMQLHNGGIALWPGDDSVQPWVTVYAAHFVVEAKRAGHPVEGFLHDALLDYVAESLNTEQTITTGTAQRIAYAAYVLARAGRADLGAMDFLREKHGKDLTSDSRALLAAAYAAVGNRDAVADLIKSLGEVETIARQTGENLDSTVRRRALVLLAMQDAAPSDPRVPRLAEQLMREVDLGEWTTQESSMALLAVGQLFQKQATRKPYRGDVYVGDRKIASFDNKPTRIVLPGGGAVRVEMTAGYEPGAAFFSLRSRGVPTDAAFRSGSVGMEVKRSFYDRDGQPLDLDDVKQGDLVVVKAEVRSIAGPIENVVVQNLLPSGLEVENPRLTSSESLPWVEPDLEVRSLDVRDDRVLLFVDLPANAWRTTFAVLRAVSPGKFRLPPLQAEAMYDPALRATGERGTIEVKGQ